MSAPSPLAQSVKARLRNRAAEVGENLDTLLTRYAIERLLYRLGQSPYADGFVLKGAILFWLWQSAPHRPTRDLDLLGLGFDQDDGPRMADIFTKLCDLDVEPDGLAFQADSVTVTPIREGGNYHGQRVKLLSLLDRTKVNLQVDIGFGDVVVPRPEWADFPALLDFPAPRLRAYPRETVVAEKLHALVKLGLANSRVKDLVDLRELSLTYAFNGGPLTTAVAATFNRRGTMLPEIPISLTDEFVTNHQTQQLWVSFFQRIQQASPPLTDVIAALREFLLPVISAVRRRESLEATWQPGGPWEG